MWDPLGLLRGELRGNGEHVSTRQHKEKHVYHVHVPPPPPQVVPSC